MFRVKIWIKVPVYKNFRTYEEAEQYLDEMDRSKPEEVFDESYPAWDEAEAEGDFV